MIFKRYSPLVLLLTFSCFSISEESYDFCVGRKSTLCHHYLKVRTTLNLTRAMKDEERSRSCFGSYGLSRQGDLALHYNCFCDSLCDYYEDCCADYDLWYRRSSVPVHTNLTCRSVHGQTQTGYLMIDTCLSTTKNKLIKKKCEEDSDELLRILPVTDEIKNTLFKNVFCAICNGVRSLKYWKVELPNSVVHSNKNQTLEKILAQSTKWKFLSHDNHTQYLRYCKPQHPGCKNGTSLAHLLRMNSSDLRSVCNSYSFQLEVCNTGSHEKISYRNLHCMLCDGMSYNDSTNNCNGGTEGGFIPQTIAFDFVAHSSFSSSHDKQATRVIRYRCDAKSTYNPFTDKCQSFNDENTLNNKTNVSGQVEKKVQTTFRNSTCMKLSGNSSQNVSVLLNGSLVIQGRIRDDVKLEVIDNSSFICWKNTLSSTNTSRGHPDKRPSGTALGLITVVGFVLSAICLLFLLLTYAIFPELRTTPGKCVMSLSCALLLYMACHVPMTSTSYPILCVGNAFVFHYSVLLVFGWLSILAFDISMRFGSQAIETVAARADRSKTTRKRFDSLFFKYSAYSWGMPLAIVSTCIALDITDTLRFGYGQGLYCYISTSYGIIAAVIAPVSVILLFNLTALVRTILGIHKLKKDSSIASQRSSQSSSAVLYLKLTCLFGLSWILNIIFAFTQNIFVAYLTVSLNSCQGIFICLGFCFNERVLSFYKTKLGMAPTSKHSQKPSERSQTNFTNSTRL